MRSAFTLFYILLLKFWVYTGHLPKCTNCNWTSIKVPLHILLCRKVLVSNRNYARSMIWMDRPLRPYKWSIRIFFFHLSPLIPRDIFHQVNPQKRMTIGGDYPHFFNGHLFSRLCLALRTDVLLGSRCDHQPIFCRPYSW